MGAVGDHAGGPLAPDRVGLVEHVPGRADLDERLGDQEVAAPAHHLVGLEDLLAGGDDRCAHRAVAVDLGLDGVAVRLFGAQRRHERVEVAVGSLHLALDVDPRLVGGVGAGRRALLQQLGVGVDHPHVVGHVFLASRVGSSRRTATCAESAARRALGPVGDQSGGFRRIRRVQAPGYSPSVSTRQARQRRAADPPALVGANVLVGVVAVATDEEHRLAVALELDDVVHGPDPGGRVGAGEHDLRLMDVVHGDRGRRARPRRRPRRCRGPPGRRRR